MRVRIDLAYVLKRFAGGIAVTWVIVLVENGLIAVVPLSVGMTIDGLLEGRMQELGWLVATLVALGCVAVGRRFYDTRVYGTIRLRLGSELQRRNSALQVSKHSVRIDMSRELVDFLEIQVPELMTAIVQICVSLAVLTWFDVRLGLSCCLVVAGMLLIYACFHRMFYRYNGLLNDQKERQIDILVTGGRRGVFRHLRALRGHEVSISDMEAVLYGGIFLLQIAFVAFNLFQGSRIGSVSAGQFFAIATYSWDYVEAALLLPVALQSWSRLSEICNRLNEPEGAPSSHLPSQP